jgi:hypothetical protein
VVLQGPCLGHAALLITLLAMRPCSSCRHCNMHCPDRALQAKLTSSLFHSKPQRTHPAHCRLSLPLPPTNPTNSQLHTHGAKCPLINTCQVTRQLLLIGCRANNMHRGGIHVSGAAPPCGELLPLISSIRCGSVMHDA